MASGRNVLSFGNANHVDEIMRILQNDEEITDIEDFDEVSDIDDEDAVEFREEDSDTEQEDSDEDEEADENNPKYYFWGKDKVTKWFHDPKSNIVQRTSNQNLIRRLPGVIGGARQASTPMESWSCFFTNDIMEIIVHYTNQYIEKIREKYGRERDAKCIDLIELKAFIGLLYLAGVYKSNRLSLEELWGTNGDGVEKFGLVMNIKRFKFIVRCLRFDDLRTREARKKLDRLAPVRDIFTRFVQNCQKNYCLGENVTIDEKLEAFRGRCSFRQYIPSKPAKYGLKIFALVDAKLCYLYNLEIYAGKQPNGEFEVSNKPADVVKRLIQPIEGSGRNLTADNWFTDFDLVEYLRKNKITYVGTVKKNKRQLPQEFVSSARRPEYDSKFGFNYSRSTSLVSYVPKKGKTVILVSSLHQDKTIDPETGDRKKPSIITFYNGTKGGVDTADKMCASFNVARNTRRWPMVIFFSMLNMSSINSQIIYFGNGGKEILRRLFIKELSHALVADELARRSVKTSGIPVPLQEKLKRFRANGPEEAQSSEEPSQKKRRCFPCTTQTRIRRLSRYQCKKCTKALCLQHANFLCGSCLDHNPEPIPDQI